MRSKRFQRGIIGEIISSLIGGYASYKGQEKANETQIDLANTAHQREVKDLQEAGLNPMLSYMSKGAATPQITNAAGAGVSSAQQGGALAEGINRITMMSQQKDNLSAQTELLKAQSRKADAEADVAVNSITPDIYGREAASSAAQIHAARERGSYESDIERRRAEASSAKSAAERDKGSWEADVRRRKAEATLAELDIPRMKGEAKFHDEISGGNKWLRLILGVANDIRSLGRK